MDFNPNYQYLLAKKRREGSDKQFARISEVQRLARSAAVAANCEPVPTELNKLSRSLGVAEIREVPLAMRGRLLHENGRFVIEVNSDLSHYDKRQTIAHELGHLLVEKDTLLRVPNRSERAQTSCTIKHGELEKLCDAAAAEILVPLRWLEEAVWKKHVSLILVKILAEQTDTNVETIAARLLEESLWRCRFVFWKTSRDALSATKSYPYLDDVTLAWMEPEGGMRSLLEECVRKKCFVQGEETVKISGESYRYKIQCVPLDDTHIVSLLQA